MASWLTLLHRIQRWNSGATVAYPFVGSNLFATIGLTNTVSRCSLSFTPNYWILPILAGYGY